MNENNHVLTIKTVQIQPIRNLTTALKDILTDATITFTKDSMKIINIDKTHTMLVSVILHANKFELYKCVPTKSLSAPTRCTFSSSSRHSPTTTH